MNHLAGIAGLTLMTLLTACTGNTRVNPFLEEWNTPYGIPPFDKIEYADYVPAFKAGIEQQQKEIEAIIANTDAPTFDNVIGAMELSGSILSKVQGVFYNVSETENCPELVAIEEEITPLVSEHSDNIYMNKDLYKKVAAVYNADQSGLTREQQMVLKKTYEAFERNGIGLDEAKQARLREINTEMSAKTNKIGYVAAMGSDNSEVTGGIDAFALGIYSVNPDAKVYVKVTNSWYDPEGEKAAAQKLLDMDCDVIAQHCDTVDPQVLAQKKGVYSIGYNSDMSKEAPKACLCSVIWNWSAYYTAAVQSVIDGTWDGSNYYGGMNENLVGITPVADFAAKGTQEKVDEAKKQILSGENGVFDGVIETNTGDTVGTEGKTLDDATITGKINWYFKTVTVVD